MIPKDPKIQRPEMIPDCTVNNPAGLETVASQYMPKDETVWTQESEQWNLDNLISF